MTATAPNYNPLVMGFSAQDGPLNLPLQTARARFGRLPSQEGLLALGEHSTPALTQPTLNTRTGRMIRQAFGVLPGADAPPASVFSLKRHVWEFFTSWHRNYRAEFGVFVQPFFNRNLPETVFDILQENRKSLQAVCEQSLWELVTRENLLRDEQVRNLRASFANALALPLMKQPLLWRKMRELLAKKLKSSPQYARQREMRLAIATLDTQVLADELEQVLQKPIYLAEYADCKIFADEIATFFGKCPAELGWQGLDRLLFLRRQGIEFRYAARDRSYLSLGTRTQDCTSRLRGSQLENTENIYWTVFAWLLDLHYQILEVWLDGKFYLKTHLLPLFFYEAGEYRFFLGVDAIETVTEWRFWENMQAEDQARARKVFAALVGEVQGLASRMGIDRVYAEKFSNSDWVRIMLREEFAEIFLPLYQIHKMDELEDVYECACAFAVRQQTALPNSIFMEVQMKNSALLAEAVYNDSKAFALWMGDAQEGLRMNRVAKV